MKKILLTALLIINGFFAIGAEITPQQINQALGFQLMAGKETWSKDALQKRLGIKLIGNAKRFSSRYPRPVAGAAAVEVEIHTDDSSKRVRLITFTFANQGDTRGNYKSVITRSRRALSSTLTRHLGQKRKGGFSDGNLKIKGDMWQTEYARIILEIDRGDFILLHILPPGGMKEAVDPGRKDFSKNVERNDFGDVFIPNVPMVDQGPKGYCVPATMARIFLYFGIHADMHHLAKIGDTDSESGTSSYKMLQDIKRLRRKARLRMKEFTKLSVKNVARYINKGYPVMWRMYSTDDLNKVYSFSRANRHKARTPDEWKRKLKGISVSSSTEGPHALLIIGYNRDTDEIAVTNSWGNSHIKPLWIPMKVARRVSQDHMIVFSP